MKVAVERYSGDEIFEKKDFLENLKETRDFAVSACICLVNTNKTLGAILRGLVLLKKVLCSRPVEIVEIDLIVIHSPPFWREEWRFLGAQGLVLLDSKS